MKALYYSKYGTIENLSIKEFPIPIPKEYEVLVKVYAASLNSWDNELLKGEPKLFRFWGLFKPKFNIPGGDIAGIVESVGSKVTKFKVGDKVFGDLCNIYWGGFAEYTCAREDLLTQIKEINYVQAASLPQAAVLAYQGIFDYGQIKDGQKILINGAGGGVGSFAIQFAKLCNVEVTAVDKLLKLDKMKAIGADYVIDYNKEDFTQNGKKYDLILDTSAHHSISDYKNSLTENGKYIVVGGSVNLIMKVSLLGKLYTRRSNRSIKLLMHQPNKHLDKIAGLVAAKKVTPLIDKIYTLENTIEAYSRMERGEVIGKAVIEINN